MAAYKLDYGLFYLFSSLYSQTMSFFGLLSLISNTEMTLMYIINGRKK